ncbi:AAA family ATPase [Nocardiopsis sp. CT-R113]|uniref:AAA family ATPase n=1 Tax=Nocardiopsis codii TaxID=3065942 RepID=A0ABU7KGR7_9ACTN|nr:AAA family ATPase [Nocardiopsis sp. CT-R113]MEE2041435.1 AAA family ATPase [Nocardiopsis sp. CT-R113]
MAHHEQHGSGRSSEAGTGPEAEERSESLWESADGDAAEAGEPAAGVAPEPSAPEREPSAPSPSPREQWFGGFEGAAPPPPPYARLPEDTPPPVPGTGYQAPPPDEEDDPGLPGDSGGLDGLGGLGDAGDAGEPERPENTVGADDTPAPENEARGGPVRSTPGPARRPQRPQRPQRLQRPTRPGGGGPDPLAPRRLRSDSDVPEPEQLPPLDTERVTPSGVNGSEGPAPVSGPHPAPGSEPGTRTPPGRGPDGFGPEHGVGSEPTPPPAPGPGRVPGPWADDERTDVLRPAGPGPADFVLGRTDSGPRRGPEPPPTLTGPRAGLVPVSTRPSGQPLQQRPEQDGETADALNAATLVRNRRQGPSGGWRRAVHSATLGLVNPGESAKVLRQRELVARACTPVATGHHRVAVLSLKGGVGKTTTTVALGATLASLRGDRVLAVDANPDRGTLSDKVRLETAATIRDLLNERHLVSRYADIRGFTSQSPSRLEILASDRDPAVSEAFSDGDYREVARLVEHFYSICLTDCGTGLLHSAMRGVLGLADQVVLVSSASVDGARSASATLDWLEAHGHGSLVRGAVVVLSMVRSNSKSSVDLNRLEEHFAGRCRDVVRVPWDGHLEEGAEVDLEQLAPGTRDAYLQLAASVGEAFAWRR